MCLYAGLDETGDEVQVRVIKAQVKPGEGVRCDRRRWRTDRLVTLWSHKIFDAQIKITRHIAKVYIFSCYRAGSSNHFRSEGDSNVKCSNNNSNHNMYLCMYN